MLINRIKKSDVTMDLLPSRAYIQQERMEWQFYCKIQCTKNYEASMLASVYFKVMTEEH